MNSRYPSREGSTATLETALFPKSERRSNGISLYIIALPGYRERYFFVLQAPSIFLPVLLNPSALSIWINSIVKVLNSKKPNSLELFNLKPRKPGTRLTAGIPIKIGIDGNTGNGVIPEIGKEKIQWTEYLVENQLVLSKFHV